MFQNIIFDIGGVLFTWDPEKFVRIILGEQADITYFSDIIFKSKEWKELDRGSYSIEHLKKV
ncbi:MAG: HAD family phosphatase, partial [Asgard group archaeon]|nr:HAD family phosphatase [Asgard group archaeon]